MTTKFKKNFKIILNYFEINQKGEKNDKKNK